ncbi:MAG: type I secretion system permease/ATPase [Maricaulaceae bacterium]
MTEPTGQPQRQPQPAKDETAEAASSAPPAETSNVAPAAEPASPGETGPQALGVITPKTVETSSAAATPGTKPAAGHWFWGPFAKSWWIYGQVALAATVTNVFALGSSLFIMTVYDRVIPNNAIDSLVALSVGMAIVICFDYAIKMLRAYFIDIASQRTDIEVGHRLFDHIMNMSLAAKKSSSGAFAGTMREFETLRDFFTSATFVAVVDLPFILLFLGVIFVIGGPLVQVPAGAIPVVLIAALIAQPMMARLSKKTLTANQQKHGVLVEAISGLETVKTTGAAPMMADRWGAGVAHSAYVGGRTRVWSQLAMNAAAFAQQATQVGIVIYGVFLIREGALSMGALVACVILSGRALAPLGQLASVLSRANQSWASYKALDAVMKTPRERPPETATIKRARYQGALEFRNVVFKYEDQPVRALDDISFKLAPGERVAVLGRIGSGKSTLARLALGLYQPEEGSVLVDHTELRQLDPDDFRRNVGAVLQDVFLFSGTIRENILISAPEAGDDAMIEAAKLAGLHDMIGQLPSGYDRMLAERGEGLSGGQRQAIAIARAIVKDPPILIMDEPTSAMDVRSETAFIQRMKPIVANKTVMIVTHRTTMLELVDKIIVVEQGKIAAAGPKEQVLRSLANARNPNAQQQRPAAE